MQLQPRFSLLAATRHIGWGGVGKLRLILDKLPDANITLHGDEHMVAMTRRFLGSQHAFDASTPPKFDVALVINDPAVANGIADLDVPVVYVDSLPYVHKTDGDIPQLAKLAHYCAQKYPSDAFPLTNPLLRSWKDIQWIDPIVPVLQTRIGGQGIVISMGGLYAYNLTGIAAALVDDAVESYLNLVLFPLVEILQNSDRKISAICGNINADVCERLRAMVRSDGVAIGPQSPESFERTLAGADLLFTSPGSTTILQALALDLPTLLLPSQNRSQFINAQVYSKRGTDVMQWPASVLDVAELDRRRDIGLGAVNSYIYGSIVAAATSRRLSDEVEAVMKMAVSHAPDDGVLDPRLHTFGTSGADQVAQLVKQVALG